MSMAEVAAKLWNRGANVAALTHPLPCILFGLVLTATLRLRGAGWDGDSLVSIAQFAKLIRVFTL
jgi:hypothetical protein